MMISAIQIAAALAVVVIVLLAVLVFVAVRGRATGPRHLEKMAEQLFGALSGRLDRIDELSRQVGEISNLFLVPRTRGAVGEMLLGEYLGTWLPKSSYELQYQFRNGTRADAVIRLGGYLVPVDSKFPLESVKRAMSEGGDTMPAEVRRAVQKHMDDISSKYIQPNEGTLHFALMYIPSERVYYYLFVENEQDLLSPAVEKGVVPVSPANLFLYLQTVAYGLRGFALSKSDRELVDGLQQTQKEFQDLAAQFGIAGTHLRNLQKVFDDLTVRISRLEISIRRLTKPE